VEGASLRAAGTLGKSATIPGPERPAQSAAGALVIACGVPLGREPGMGGHPGFRSLADSLFTLGWHLSGLRPSGEILRYCLDQCPASQKILAAREDFRK